MEIIGDDKKLRALFSEAQTVDAAATPSFTSVWHRAQARSLKPGRAFNLSFALVTALLVLTLGSLALWSAYSHRGTVRNDAAGNHPQPASGVQPNQQTKEENTTAAVNTGNRPVFPVPGSIHRSVKPRVKRSSAAVEQQLVASTKTTARETTIETWQSPTSALLTSPTDGLFKSVPQLNENANEMKSFLPGRSNEKEK